MLNRDHILRTLKREAERYSAHPRGEDVQTFDFLFLFASTVTEERELVQKMGDALKLPKDRWSMVAIPQMSIIDLCIATRIQSARTIVLFGASADFQLQGPAELIRAPMLSDLLVSSDHKRILWEKLKAALRRL